MPLHQMLFAILCVVACGHALARGALPERITACSIFAAFILTNAFKSPHDDFFRVIEWRIWIIDSALFVSFLAVALTSARFWPMAMVCMHSASVLAHLAKALDHTIWPYVYIVLANLISWPIVILLIVATERHRRRLHRYGVDFSWVWQLPPAYRDGWRVHERGSAFRLER